jgi:hypothetical protein
MFTTTEHKTIVTLLAAGKPIWYVAAVTKADAHGASYGYPDRTRLRQVASAHGQSQSRDAQCA